jgi:dUTPase
MIIIHNPVTGINDCDKTTCICSPNATAYRINKGEKIAQVMLCEHKSVLLGIESDTERTNGFGSTGDK